jgi:hypothetical protein
MAATVQQQAISFFEGSYKDYALYPTNLVYRASYRKVLESYKNRLDKASTKLFLKEATQGHQLDVRFRDYNIAEKSKLTAESGYRNQLSQMIGFDEVQENEIDSLTSLRVHLGDASTATNWTFNKTDPRCRYV